MSNLNQRDVVMLKIKCTIYLIKRGAKIYKAILSKKLRRPIFRNFKAIALIFIVIKEH